MPLVEQEPSQQHAARPAKISLPEGDKQFTDVPSIPAAGIFATSDVRFLKQLARASSQRTAVPGEVFITAGEHNDTAFVLLHGDVEIVTDNTPGREAFSRVLSAPNIFGEDCVLKPRQASLATVRAHTACHMRTLSGQAFKNLLRRFPEEKHFFHLHAKSRLEELGVTAGEKGCLGDGTFGRSPFVNRQTDGSTASLGEVSGNMTAPYQRPPSVASSGDSDNGGCGREDLPDMIQSAIYAAGVSCGNGGRRGTPEAEPAPMLEVSARDVALSNARVSAALLRERLLGKEECGPPPSLGCNVLATTLPILDMEPRSLDMEPTSPFNRGSRLRRSKEKSDEPASHAGHLQVGSPQSISVGGSTFSHGVSAGNGLSPQAGSGGPRTRGLQPSLAAAYSARLARATDKSRPVTGSSLADRSAATSERSDRSVQLCLSTQASTHTLFSHTQQSEEHHQTTSVDWRRGHRHHTNSSKGKAVNSVGGHSAPSRSPDAASHLAAQCLSPSNVSGSPEGYADPQPPPPQLSAPPPPPEGGSADRRSIPFTLKGDEFYFQGGSPRPRSPGSNAYTPSGRSARSVRTTSVSRESSTGSYPLSPVAKLQSTISPPAPIAPLLAGLGGQADVHSRLPGAELDSQAEVSQGSSQGSPRGSPQPAWNFSPRSRSSSADGADDQAEDEFKARGVLLMGGLAGQNRSHTSSAQSLSVQSVTEGVLTPSAPQSPRLRGVPQVRHRGSRPMTPSGGDGTSLPQLREGWQVSLCQNVMMWCPSALPSKDTFTQKKVPRPVSPDNSKARSPRPDPSILDEPAAGDPPSATCASGQEPASFEPISPKGSPLRRRPRRVVQAACLSVAPDIGSQAASTGAQAASTGAQAADMGSQAASTVAQAVDVSLPKAAASGDQSPAAESAAAIEEDGIGCPVSSRWASEVPRLTIAPPSDPPPAKPPAAPAAMLGSTNDAFEQLLLHRLSNLSPRINSATGGSDESPRSPAAGLGSPRPLPSAEGADAAGSAV